MSVTLMKVYADIHNIPNNLSHLSNEQNSSSLGPLSEEIIFSSVVVVIGFQYLISLIIRSMEPLADPLHDRRVHTVTPPPRAVGSSKDNSHAVAAQPLTPELLFPNGEEAPPDWRCLRKHLVSRRNPWTMHYLGQVAEGRLYIESITRIVKELIRLCAAEANVVHVKDPVTVVGDIHGQY